MNDSILDAKNLIGIVVEPMLLQKCIELGQVMAVEQNHGLPMWWDVTLRATGKCSG